MSDLRVRDHSQPCEHGNRIGHVLGFGKMIPDFCPGGREIVLRERQLRDFFAGWPPDQTVYVVEEA